MQLVFNDLIILINKAFHDTRWLWAKRACVFQPMKDEYLKPNNGSNYLCDIKLPNSPPLCDIGKKVLEGLPYFKRCGEP
jgi:hypothetical protein